MSKFALLLTSVLVPTFVFAGEPQGGDEGDRPPSQTRPYSFSGPCTSQGSWTQAALSQSGRIRELVIQLKNDTNCTGLGQSLQRTLSAMEEQLRTADHAMAARSRLSQIPGEISGLRQFVTSDRSFQGKVINQLFGRAFEQSELAAKTGAPMSTPADGRVQSTAEALMGLGDRVHRAAVTGLDLFNSMVTTAPQLDQCLVAPQGMAHFFAASVRVLSSFASSGEDGTGLRIAQAVSKLSNVMGREAKFADMLRQLNEQDFLVSMSCLMEVTAESYCSAREGMGLFQKIMKEKAIAKPANADGSMATNPLYGYYILNQHLPVVNNWLQQIQIGVASKRPEDATAKIKIINEVQNFFNAVENINAMIAFESERIMSEGDIDAQRTRLIKLIKNIISVIRAAGGGDAARSDIENFFTDSISLMEIPFKLIGQPVPDELRDPKADQSAEDYIEAHYAEYDGFKNPKAFLITIQSNFKDIDEKARRAALNYYNRYYVADQVSVVNRALLGPNHTVRGSFSAIDSYLAALDRKIIANGADPSMLSSIRETRRSIRSILKAFDEVKKFGEKVATRPNIDDDNFTDDMATEQDAELMRVTSNLLQTVYDKLNILKARTSFLANRLADYVHMDYDMMLKSRMDFSPYHQELYRATGEALVDNMIRIAGNNPANVQTDLTMALRLNKGNLEVLEKLIKNPFAAQIAFLKLIGENRRPGAWDLFWESNMRAYIDSASTLPGEMRNPPWQFLRGFFGALWNTTVNADRYPYMGVTKLFNFSKSGFRHSADDEFGSAKALQAQLCTQALAFGDLRAFWTVCKGTTMKTPYVIASPMQIEGQNAEDYLSVNFEKKAVENREDVSMNQSQRICAFRDYNRRNLVVYLTESSHEEEMK